MNIGFIHYQKGQLAQAKACFTAARAIYLQAEDDTSIQQAQVANNMAGVCAAEGQWTEAEKYLREALRLLPDKGREHDQINYMQSLGAVCYQQGKTDEAHTIWQQAYDLSVRALGAEHPLTQQLKQYLL